MNIVNRTVLVLRPKTPYVEWANGFEGPSLAPEEYGRMTSVFLVPELDTDEDAAAYVRDNYQTLFEHELEAWMRDEHTWPDDRSWDVFRAWFEVEIYTTVVDLGEEPLALAVT
jgi:hypothetical protein